MKKACKGNPATAVARTWRRAVAAMILSLASASGIADVELQMQAYREVETAQDDGSVLIRREPATHLHHGDRLLLTIHYRNDSDSAADRVIIENPVPDSAVYLPGGAGGEGAEIEVSTDGGASYREADGVNPALVSHIRWVVRDVPPQAEGEVFVRLRVYKVSSQP